MIRKMILPAALLLLLQLNVSSFAGELFLVKNGKSCAGIVLPESACITARYAAEELSTFAKKMTGSSIPIYKTRKALPKGMLPIIFSLQNKPCTPPLADKAFLQKCKGIKDDGFAIYAKSGRELHIRGARPRSLLYGVYYILKKNGIFFLYPHPRGKGDHIPRKNSLSIGEGSLVKNPAFSSRRITLNGGSRINLHNYEWFIRNGLQVYAAGTRLDAKVMKFDPVLTTGGHSMGSDLVGNYGKKFTVARAELLKEKPYLFGLVNGKRVIAGNERGCCQPCTSNKETRERMLKNIKSILAKFNGRENVRIFCNDDHVTWCECENCKKLDDPKAPRSNRHADRWWHYVNYMAKNILSDKNPDQKMKILAYQTFRFPPRTIQPDPRVMVEICPHQRCYIHSLTDPNCPPNATTFRKMFEVWAKKGMRCTTFEYHTQMPGATRYLPMERAWAEDLRFYKKLNMAGFGLITRAAYSDFGRRNDPFNLHMWMSLWQLHYLTGHLSWEIDADVEKVLEKINSLFYGKAWKEMKPYRKLLLEALHAPKGHMGYGTSDMALGRCMESAGLSEKLHAYLAGARKLVKNSPLHLERVKQEEYFLNESWGKAYQLYKENKQKEYIVKKRLVPITIDGKLNEADWKSAQSVTSFMVHAQNKKEAAPQTFAKMLFDANNLYFAIECMKAPGKAPKAAPGNGIPHAMLGSHIELFLAPPYLQGRYYHFGISRNGKRFGALTYSGSARDEKIFINFQCKITEEKDKWIAEIRLPLVAPLKPLREGDVWKVNIGRAAVTRKGSLESSSWSAGLFHSPESYRTAAFGEKGPILRNGDLEDLVKPRIRKHLKKEWTYLSNSVPKYWSFNYNNTGKVEMRQDQAASGRNYMRITGLNAFLGQSVTFPKGVKEVFLSLKARGKGEIYSRIFGKQKNGFIKKIDTKGKWVTVSGNIKLPENPSFFWLRITGTIDLDDIFMIPSSSPEEDMPTAEKHK